MITKSIQLKCLMVLILNGLFLPDLLAGGVVATTNYRWRNDDGNEIAATWKDTINTGITVKNINEVLRLRIGIENPSGQGAANRIFSHVLEYQEANSNNWNIINHDDNNAFILVSSGFVAHKDTTSNLLLSSSFPFFKGNVLSDTTSSTDTLIFPGYTELEFVLKPTLNILDTAKYEFRILNLDAGGSRPTLATEIQKLVANYRWRNDDGNQANASWKDTLNEPTTLQNKKEVLRLRYGIEKSSGHYLDSISFSQALLYRTRYDTSWVLISYDSAHAFVLANSNFIAHNDITTNLLLTSSYPFVSGRIIEDTTSLLYTLRDTGYTEFEFVIKPTSKLLDTTEYEFKIMDLDANYTKMAKLNTEFNVDSVRIFTEGNIEPVIDVHDGVLSLKAEVTTDAEDKSVIWSIIPIAGDATIDANGIVTPVYINGSVWAKAVSAIDPTKADSLEVTIINQKIKDIIVTTVKNMLPLITEYKGTIRVESLILPEGADQAVHWQIIPVTGSAHISEEGIVTAESDGTVWAKAISVQDTTSADSIMINIAGQRLDINSGDAAGFLSVSPNPVYQQIKLKADREHAPLQLKIIDVSGRLYLEQTLYAGELKKGKTIDLSFISPGMYIIVLNNEEVHYYQKFTKQ